MSSTGSIEGPEQDRSVALIFTFPCGTDYSNLQYPISCLHSTPTVTTAETAVHNPMQE